MTILDAIWQAIIQGLTEFLPVSSSGHLSLYQHFSGNNGEGALMFSALLHLGTLAAVIAVFWRQIANLVTEFIAMIKDIFTGKFTIKNVRPERRVIFMFIISTAVLIPFYIFKGFFESFAEDSSIFVEGLCFLYTAAILIMADLTEKGRKRMIDLRTPDAVRIGFFQAVALLPGVSRSGSTISAGIFSGLKREEAVSYSFILGIPAILGGGLTELIGGIGSESSAGVLQCIIGVIVAAAVGFGAIKLVQWLMKTDRFKIFAIYTAALGVIVIVISIIEAIMGKPITFVK